MVYQDEAQKVNIILMTTMQGNSRVPPLAVA